MSHAGICNGFWNRIEQLCAGGRSQLLSLPLECSSCHLRYMQALGWLPETVCFEAIGHVSLSHYLESHQANISVHHLSMWRLQMCIDHTMTLVAVSSPICCMHCSWSATSASVRPSWIYRVGPMDLMSVEAVQCLEVSVE